MIDSGDSQVVQESPRESLFKDHYFESGRGIGSGNGRGNGSGIGTKISSDNGTLQISL